MVMQCILPRALTEMEDPATAMTEAAELVARTERKPRELEREPAGILTEATGIVVPPAVTVTVSPGYIRNPNVAQSTRPEVTPGTWKWNRSRRRMLG